MCYARRQRSSWARIKLSKKLYIKRLLRLFAFLRLLSFFQSLISLLFLLFWFTFWFVFQKNCRDLCFYTSLLLPLGSYFTLYFLSLTVQFSMTICFAARFLAHSLYIIPHLRLLVKRFSKSFLSFFILFSPHSSTFRLSFPIIPPLSPFVNTFFWIFCSIHRLFAYLSPFLMLSIERCLWKCSRSINKSI